ncbi:MAG: NAD(P)-binding domain-containing protein [Bacteroidota bacterium]
MAGPIGIIGAGNIGQAIARLLVKGGHQVLIGNSKGPESLTTVMQELGHAVKAVTAADAARQEIVVLALPWTSLDSLTQLTDWSGKIVIDATNHFIRHTPPMQLADLGGKTSSQITLEHLPGALLIKAFNTLYYKLLQLNPVYEGGNRVLFVSGDDTTAKNTVVKIIESMGFAAIDLGSLETGGQLQQAGGSLAGKNLILMQ